MEFTELVRTRRSVRRYQETPVPRELLRELLETACWAPSGDNLQPWYFLALTEPQEIARLKGTMERVSVEIEEHLEGIFQGRHPEVVREEQRFLRRRTGRIPLPEQAAMQDIFSFSSSV